MINKNFSERIHNLETPLQLWSGRFLSLKGKVTIIQTLALPQLLYTANVLYTPPWVIDKVNKLLVNFLWNNKKPKIKLKTVIGEIDKGGLKMPHFESKLKALKITWSKHMLHNSVLPWKEILKVMSQENMEDMLLFQRKACHFPKEVSSFYSQFLEYWSQLRNKQIQCATDVHAQILWTNSSILIDNKPVLQWDLVVSIVLWQGLFPRHI